MVIRQISRSHGTKNRKFLPQLNVSGLQLKFEFTDSYEIIHNAWSNIEEAPIVFQGHPSNFEVTRDKKSPILCFNFKFAKDKNAYFDRKWAFPGGKSSLTTLMAMKWCTKLKAIKKRGPIVFQCHPSHFEVTRHSKLPISSRIERFLTVTPVWIQKWIWSDS